MAPSHTFSGALTFLPARRGAPLSFPSTSALIRHLRIAHPTGPLQLLPQQIQRDGFDVPALAIFTLRPSARRPIGHRSAPVLSDVWLGWAVGDPAALAALQGAIDAPLPSTRAEAS